MNDIIKKLVDIDDQAKEYQQETESQKEALYREIEEEKQAVYDKYMSEAEAEVESETQALRDKSEKKYRKRIDELNEISKALDAQYEANSDKWVSEIVERVLA